MQLNMVWFQHFSVIESQQHTPLKTSQSTPPGLGSKCHFLACGKYDVTDRDFCGRIQVTCIQRVKKKKTKRSLTG